MADVTLLPAPRPPDTPRPRSNMGNSLRYHRLLQTMPAKQNAAFWDKEVVNALVTRLPGGQTSVTLPCRICESVFFPCLCPARTIPRPYECRLYPPRVVGEAESRRLGTARVAQLFKPTANQDRNPTGNLHLVVQGADARGADREQIVLVDPLGHEKLPAAPPAEVVSRRKVLWREGNHWIVEVGKRYTVVMFKKDRVRHLEHILDDNLAVEENLSARALCDIIGKSKQVTYDKWSDGQGDILLGLYGGQWEVRRLGRNGQGRAFDAGVRVGHRLVRLETRNRLSPAQWEEIDPDELPLCWREQKDTDTKHIGVDGQPQETSAHCDRSAVVLEEFHFRLTFGMVTGRSKAIKVVEVWGEHDDDQADEDDFLEVAERAAQQEADEMAKESVELGTLTRTALRQAIERRPLRPFGILFEEEAYEAVAIRGPQRARHAQEGETRFLSDQSMRMNNYNLFHEWASTARCSPYQLQFVFRKLEDSVLDEIKAFERGMAHVRKELQLKCTKLVNTAARLQWHIVFCESCTALMAHGDALDDITWYGSKSDCKKCRPRPGNDSELRRLKDFGNALTSEVETLFKGTPDYFLRDLSRHMEAFFGRAQMLGTHVQQSEEHQQDGELQYSADTKGKKKDEEKIWRYYRCLLKQYTDNNHLQQQFDLSMGEDLRVKLPFTSPSAIDKEVSHDRTTGSPVQIKRPEGKPKSVARRHQSGAMSARSSPTTFEDENSGKSFTLGSSSDGKLSPKEFGREMFNAGMTWIDQEGVRRLFDSMDVDQNGKLTLVEIKSATMRMRDMLMRLIAYKRDLEHEGRCPRSQADLMEAFLDILRWGEDLVGPQSRRWVPDHCITASGYYLEEKCDQTFAPHNVRLDSPTCWIGNDGLEGDGENWIQWNFQEPVVVTTVVTKGPNPKNLGHNMVLTYRIQYNETGDSNGWRDYKCPSMTKHRSTMAAKPEPGDKGERKQRLDPELNGVVMVRLRPIDWEGERPRLRATLLGFHGRASSFPFVDGGLVVLMSCDHTCLEIQDSDGTVVLQENASNFWTTTHSGEGRWVITSHDGRILQDLDGTCCAFDLMHGSMHEWTVVCVGDHQVQLKSDRERMLSASEDGQVALGFKNGKRQTWTVARPGDGVLVSAQKGFR